MVTFLPISSPFIRFAGRFVDDAFGVAAGWNFFIFEAALVPFEIVACNVIIGFWSDVVPTGAIIAIVIVLYAYVISLLHPNIERGMHLKIRVSCCISMGV
jgi:amino acid transporter